jgi:hypothetical protein
MRIRNAWLSATVAGSAYVLCACAGVGQSDGERSAPQLRIYTFGEISMSRYDVVGRLPVDSWRTAFRLPTFPSEGQAIAALQTEAAKLGADGLLNVSCLDQGRGQWWSSTEPAFLCYGIAIRVRPSQG